MAIELIDFYNSTASWANNNQGVVTIAIFLVSILLGWVSGIFSGLRRRPKFKIKLLEGPNICCTYEVGKLRNGMEVHQTAIALYLHITNVGSAPSSIHNISVGYHWQRSDFNLQGLRYSVGRFWLENQVVSLEDFQVAIGESKKVYPFLIQKNSLVDNDTNTYLKVGQFINGVVYFEQHESWGACRPEVLNGKAKIKVRVEDIFGKKHSSIFDIPVVTLEAARKYNSAFGKTLAELHGDKFSL